MTNHQYGPKGHIVDAFLEHLKQMTEADWLAVFATWDAASDAVWDAARDTTGYDDAWYDAWGIAWDVARRIVGVGSAVRYAAGYAAGEILGADLLRERGQPFFFLPMFGFADEQAIIKQENAA
jgi:hypothetical protein